MQMFFLKALVECLMSSTDNIVKVWLICKIYKMTHVVNLIVPKYHLSFTWKLTATKQIDQIINREFLVRNYTLHKVERWGHLKLYSVAMCTVKRAYFSAPLHLYRRVWCQNSWRLEDKFCNLFQEMLIGFTTIL